MLWIFLLVLTTLCWGIYDLFFKVLEKDINYFLALLIIGAIQFLIALPFVIYYGSHSQLASSARGVGYSIIMGALLAFGTVFFFYAFRLGTSASVAIPAYAVGMMLIGAIGGVLLFREPINWQLITGFILGALSIILLTWNRK